MSTILKINKIRLWIITFTIITAIIVSAWITLGIPELMKLPSDYQLIIEHEVEDRIIDYWGGPLSESIPIKETSISRSNTEDDHLIIDSSLIAIDLKTGDIIFDSFQTFEVNPYTREHASNVQGLFELPPNVKKQTYELFSSLTHSPLTLKFEKENTRLGLDVYDFSCGSYRVDDSNAWDEFAPNPVFLDTTCKMSVEPITGQIVDFQQTWHDYSIENGEIIDVAIGSKAVTDFSISVLVKSAQNKIQLYYVYETIIPILMSFIACTLLIGGIYREKLSIRIRQNIQAEIQLEIAKQKIKNERLITIGESAGRIAHDFRGLSSLIRMNLELIQISNHDLKSSKQMARIFRAVDTIDRQIESIMDFVRHTPLKLDNYSLSKIFESVKNSIDIPASIKIDFPKTDVNFWCDEKECEQLFHNLIMNSIESIGDKDGNITIKLKDTEKQFEIIFEDSGTGISSENLDKIFEPLFTTKKTGTGFGLASCKNIVERLRGTIKVQNNPTVFIIVIPKNQN